MTDMRVLTPAYQTGTHFLPSADIRDNSLSLNFQTPPRPFTSFSISTRSAFGVLLQNALYKSTVIIDYNPYII